MDIGNELEKAFNDGYEKAKKMLYGAGSGIQQKNTTDICTGIATSATNISQVKNQITAQTAVQR